MTAPTEPNRWTAVVKSTGRVLLLDGGVAALSAFGDADQAASLAAQINRTATPDDLPEGVERISDGTLWLRAGDDVPTYAAPDGYEWLTFSGEWSTKSMPYGMRPCMVQVRPIPAPATEKVPWWEAVGRKLRPPHDCPIVKVGCSGSRGPWVATSEKAIGATNFVDADGMVEVLVECES